MDVDARSGDGRTAIHYARDVATAEVLLDHGASIHVRTTSGDSPLHYAASNFSGDADLIRLLVASGSDVNGANARGRTPLMAAVEYGTAAVINALLDLGANPRVEPASGTPLMDLARANPNLFDKTGDRVLDPVFWRLNDAQY